MATKGASNRFGNTKHVSNNFGSTHIGYQWAKDFNKNSFRKHVADHMSTMGFSNPEEYRAHAVAFANRVDRVNHISFIRSNGETVKFSTKTGEFAIVDRRGYVVTYFKPREGLKYYLNDYAKGR